MRIKVFIFFFGEDESWGPFLQWGRFLADISDGKGSHWICEKGVFWIMAVLRNSPPHLKKIDHHLITRELYETKVKIVKIYGFPSLARLINS